MKQTWVAMGSKSECNMGAGEVYRQESPGKVSNLDECKFSCQDAAECKSITFFNDGWCSHYSTPCTQVKANSNANALRLTLEVRTWLQLGSFECDTSAGEVYWQWSLGLSSLDECKQSCQAAPRCKSLTFFGGRCNHFVTPCTKVKYKGGATALRLLNRRRYSPTLACPHTYQPFTHIPPARICTPWPFRITSYRHSQPRQARIKPGWRSGSRPNATPTPVRCFSSREEKYRAWRYANSHAWMQQGARASRSTTEGGATTTARRVPKPRQGTRLSP